MNLKAVAEAERERIRESIKSNTRFCRGMSIFWYFQMLITAAVIGASLADREWGACALFLALFVWSCWCRADLKKSTARFNARYQGLIDDWDRLEREAEAEEPSRG